MSGLQTSGVRIRRGLRSQILRVCRLTLWIIGRRPRMLWSWIWEAEFASLLRDRDRQKGRVE